MRIYLHCDSARIATLYGHSIHYRTDKNQVFIQSNPQSFFLIALINIVAATETLSLTYCFSNVLPVILDFKKVVESMLNCFAKNKLERINAFKVEFSEIETKKL